MNRPPALNDNRRGAPWWLLPVLIALVAVAILWEEILARFPSIEVVGPPTRVRSAFVRGFSALPVRIPG